MRKMFIFFCGVAVSAAVFTLDVASQEAAPQPVSVSKLYDSALSAFKMQEYQKAIAGFQQVLHIEPKHENSLFYSALSYRNLGQSDKEIEMYDRLLVITNPEKKAVALSNRGAALYQLKRFKDMEDSFAEAKKVDPKDALIFLNSGLLQMNIGSYQKAIEDLLAAKEKGEPSKELIWLQRILRQMTGDKLPPPDWKPNFDAYHTVVRVSGQGFFLVDMPEKGSTPATQSGGLTSVAGLPGTRLSFAGSSENPFEYAPCFYVWDGAVINDPQHEVLLENGTKFRIKCIEGGETKVLTGQVVGWKCVVAKGKGKTN